MKKIRRFPEAELDLLQKDTIQYIWGLFKKKCVPSVEGSLFIAKQDSCSSAKLLFWAGPSGALHLKSAGQVGDQRGTIGLRNYIREQGNES